MWSWSDSGWRDIYDKTSWQLTELDKVDSWYQPGNNDYKSHRIISVHKNSVRCTTYQTSLAFIRQMFTATFCWQAPGSGKYIDNHWITAIYCCRWYQYINPKQTPVSSDRSWRALLLNVTRGTVMIQRDSVKTGEGHSQRERTLP